MIPMKKFNTAKLVMMINGRKNAQAHEQGFQKTILGRNPVFGGLLIGPGGSVI